MKIAIVTTFDPSKYEQYGEEMLRTLNRYIQSPNIKVFVYYDGDAHDVTKFAKCTDISFAETVGYDQKVFAQIAMKKQKGKVIHKPNSDEYENNKEFLFDAERFSYKWFATIDAFNQFRYTHDYLIWLDADTVAFEKIEDEFFTNLISEGEIASYLGRTHPYTETGFILFNLRHSCVDEFFDRMYDMYAEEEIFYLPIWIDCKAFDVVREELEYKGFKFRNLTPGDYGHVWERSPLQKKLVHNKGLRKTVYK